MKTTNDTADDGTTPVAISTGTLLGLSAHMLRVATFINESDGDVIARCAPALEDMTRAYMRIQEAHPLMRRLDLAYILLSIVCAEMSHGYRGSDHVARSIHDMLALSKEDFEVIMNTIIPSLHHAITSHDDDNHIYN